MQTLGEFYREKILSREDLITRESPDSSGEIKIEKDLFGWKLYSGKYLIECRSGEEARYLKVFLEAGMKSVSIPKDDEYLKAILPELERLKARIDQIIHFYIEAVLNRKIRAEVRHRVWTEMLK